MIKLPFWFSTAQQNISTNCKKQVVTFVSFSSIGFHCIPFLRMRVRFPRSVHSSSNPYQGLSVKRIAYYSTENWTVRDISKMLQSLTTLVLISCVYVYFVGTVTYKDCGGKDIHLIMESLRTLLQNNYGIPII